ncbi:MAG: TPM domain-containing protein [Myxococcales bacterium]|nr:TPM domain-containing protein [Myxococcales bacterium]
MASIPLVALVTCAAATAAHARDLERRIDLPALDGAVIDRAGVIGSDIKAHIARDIAAHQRERGVGIKVLLVRTTGQTPMRAYALAAARAWGASRSRRRVLCVLAIDDRRVRIEVSNALRSQLPDREVAAVIARVGPLLRQRQYGKAVTLMVQLLRGHTTPDDRRLATLLQLLVGMALGFALPLLALRIDGPPRAWGPPAALRAMATNATTRRALLKSWYGSVEEGEKAEALHARSPRRSPWIYGFGLPLLLGAALLAQRLLHWPALWFWLAAGVVHGFALGMALLRSRERLRPIIASVLLSGGWLAVLLSAGPRPLRDRGDLLLISMLVFVVAWPVLAYVKGGAGGGGGRRGGGYHGGSSGYSGGSSSSSSSSSSSDSGFSGGGAGGSW